MEPMAPNGQFGRHMPQETHFSWSIWALPYRSEDMAFIPQALAQGRWILRIAPYGQTSMHFPHLMHFSSSMTNLPPLEEMAPLGQISLHGWARQPWQESEM